MMAESGMLGPGTHFFSRTPFRFHMQNPVCTRIDTHPNPRFVFTTDPSPSPSDSPSSSTIEVADPASTKNSRIRQDMGVSAPIRRVHPGSSINSDRQNNWEGMRRSGEVSAAQERTHSSMIIQRVTGMDQSWE